MRDLGEHRQLFRLSNIKHQHGRICAFLKQSPPEPEPRDDFGFAPSKTEVEAHVRKRMG